MPPHPAPDAASALVQQGWRELQFQRPLTAWAAWQQAIRLDPEGKAAREALDALAEARELPAAARATYRFRSPRGEEARRRWDEALRGRDLSDLDVAAAAFDELAGLDPTDGVARYNLGLCLAWLGRNAEAVAALDEAIRLDAADHADQAVEAAALAEILRQGAGAEALADDAGHTLVLDWPEDTLGDPIEQLGAAATLRPLPTPADRSDVRVAEWLDRPLPPAADGLPADELPSVRATLVATPGRLRLSSPSAESLRSVEADLERALGPRFAPLDRRTEPLPIPLMDTAAWQFRPPDGLEPEERLRLSRDGVERYYEQVWVGVPRHSLANAAARRGNPEAARTPAQAARAGDPESKARLAGSVRIREQLGRRPHVAPLYGGYPFDRLRRRVGLEPIDPATVDEHDYATMGPAELEALDPSTLEPTALLEAVRSAAPVAPEAGRHLLLALADRDPATLLRADFPNVAYDAIRAAQDEGGPAEAVGLIDRLVAADREASDGRNVGILEVLRAQVFEMVGDHDSAREAYAAVGRLAPDDPEALVAAGYSLLAGLDEAELARTLLLRALELAEKSGDSKRLDIARTLLARIDRADS